jgi:hypothetical protein
MRVKALIPVFVSTALLVVLGCSGGGGEG